MSKTLIQIGMDKLELARELIEHDGELDEVLELKLSQNDKDLSQKLDDYYWRIHFSKMILDEVKNQKKWLESQSKKAKSVMDFCKKRLIDFSGAVGDKKLSGNQWRFVVSDAAPSVEVVDADMIPGDFLVEKVSYEIDKAKIKKALESGEDVPGCRLKKGKSVRSYMNEAVLIADRQ